MAARAGAPAAPPRAAGGATPLNPEPRYARYVAIGDSSTEGLSDPDGRGGYRGWSQRLAERIAAAQGGLLYANLAVHGTTTHEIRSHQLPRAVAMQPDLASVFSGVNDVLRAHFEVREIAADVLAMQRALRAVGATVLTFTLPDLSPVMPFARLFAGRVDAVNTAIRSACAESGTLLVDFARVPVATDARLWDEDRVHANAAGHARVADALAETLGLAGTDGAWREPLPLPPPASAARVAARELRWAWRFLLPSFAGALVPRRWRGARARVGVTSPGKRPQLTPL